jgi:hypothetical protein
MILNVFRLNLSQTIFYFIFLIIYYFYLQFYLAKKKKTYFIFNKIFYSIFISVIYLIWKSHNIYRIVVGSPLYVNKFIDGWYVAAESIYQRVSILRGYSRYTS